MSENLGKKYSFCQLLENNDNSIVIPLIQRDYVQGRANKEEVRNDFLQKLYDYFEIGQNEDLDFVYGYTKDNRYIPLDGQQRLTTLFLLHNYLAYISGKESEDKWKQLINKDGLFKFRYEVRRSSTEFCKNLVKNGINFSEYELLKKDFENFEKYVQNQHWFKLSWSLDPTVASMINMLIKIHELFKGKAHFYDLLFSNDKPVLTFLFLDLEHLKQGDELYIKMNARGKMLTSFENFKARFEEKIEQLFKENDNKRTFIYKEESIELNTKDYFSFKIDSVWSNLFWNYRHLVGNPNNYDDEIFNFIKEILLYHFFKNNNDVVLLEQVFKSNLDTFKQLNDFNLISRESIDYLIQVLDALHFDNNGIKTYCSNRYFDEEKLFKLILEHKIQNPDRVKFYAYLQYVTNNDFENIGLQDWMRIVVNLVENKIFNSQDMIVSAFRSIDSLLQNADNILKYFTTDPDVAFFESNQIIEEKIKAHIICASPESYEQLFKIEQSVFHAGQIGYLLEVSNFITICDLSNNSISNQTLIFEYFDVLKQYSHKAIALFSYLDSNKNFIFERGLLTYGNYLVKKGDYQYNFSSSKKVANYERDYSWKRMLSLDYKKLSGNSWEKRRKQFYELFDDVDFNFGNVETSLLNRIKKFYDKSNWKYDFIKDPRFIELCRQGFIYTTNNFRDIQLLNASQMNHLRLDYHVIKFWFAEIFDERFNHALVSVKGNYEVPYLTAVDIKVKTKKYSIEFYNMEDNDFYVRFYKSKGYNRIDDYDDELKNMLLSIGLRWNETPEHKGFTLNSSVFKNITSKYLEILKNL